MVLRLFALFCGVIFLKSCAGYQLGGKKPEALAHVQKIYVPLATNSTQVPRAAALTTNGVVDAIVQDGTYRIGRLEDSDAVLEIELYQITYGAIRTVRENRLRPEELSMTIQLNWKVTDGANPLKVLDSGTSVGRTTLFADANLQTAQQSAINDAILRASNSLVARLADGF